jgi:transcriptional regulator with XRE-family HTH domain
MPRRRHDYRRVVCSFPCDFPLRLDRLKKASGMSWRAMARQLGTDMTTLRRWRKGRTPNSVYLYALFSLAEKVYEGHKILLSG